jgi:ATP-dependent RNA helicase MRH4, mitochondrial
MTLSRKVSQPTTKPAFQGRVSSRGGSPFGGMNQTQARIRATPERRSQAELKRATRFDKTAQDKDENPSEKNKERPLYKALKMQTALTPIPYGHRTTVKEQIRDLETFEQFPLLPVVCESIYSQALPGMMDVTPTPIQRVAIPEILNPKTRPKSKNPDAPSYDQFLLAAETGSGKTLAYLLPVIDAIKRAEEGEKGAIAAERAEKESKKSSDVFSIEAPRLSPNLDPDVGRPKAIILLPTSELVTQVGGVVKVLSHTIKYRSELISSSYSGRVIRNRLNRGVDVLISTPHLLSSIAESEPNILSRVSHLVIDEADSLLDRSFSPMTSNIIDRATPSLKQLILCSATIPRSLDSFLRRRFPECRRLVTPNLHAIPRRVQLGVVDIDKDPYRGNKDLACADAIWTIGKSAGDQSKLIGAPEIKSLIVFVNERETAVELAEYLTSKGIDAFALNRDTPEQRQSEILSEFTIPSAPYTPDDIKGDIRFEPSPPPSLPSRRRLPNTKVLVTTDIASRGIDTLAVRTVILYDIPHSTIDFIHRLGRTGRMNRRGRGIILVGKKDRKDVVREVREAMFRGQALI